MTYVLKTLAFLAVSWFPVFAQTPGADLSGIQVISHKWFYKVVESEILQPYKPGDATAMRKTSDASKVDVRFTGYYVYEISILNKTGHTIKGIEWDHIFSGLGDGLELARRKLFSIKKIHDGEIAKIQTSAVRPQPNVVRAEDLVKNAKTPFKESVELRCVVFDDNTLWKKAGVLDKECEELLQSLAKRDKSIKKNN